MKTLAIVLIFTSLGLIAVFGFLLTLPGSPWLHGIQVAMIALNVVLAGVNLRNFFLARVVSTMRKR